MAPSRSPSKNGARRIISLVPTPGKFHFIRTVLSEPVQRH